ncbi:MAG TPA: response regulator, partial [Polyangiaceae bacterium]
MFEERGTIEGDLSIARNTRLYGLVSGSVTVKAGRTLVLHGSINGDLVLEEGAVAHIYGTVGGNVFNDGSKLCVWKTGTVRGTLQRRSVNKIEAGATIRALAGEEEQPPPSQDESCELAGFRVVLVEDDHDTLEEVAALVSSHGAEAFTARHGAEGYDVFARVRPDAIVTDLWMPDGGYDFIKRVRARAPE